MNEIALEIDSCNVMTAAGFHTEFILSGITHNSFICPYCEIPLTGVKIDDSEFIKSPHFRAMHGTHTSPCTGSAAEPSSGSIHLGNVLKEVHKKYSFIPNDINFPSKLIKAHPQFKFERGDLKGSGNMPRLEIESRMRSNQLISLATQHSNTQFVRAIAEAKGLVFHYISQYADSKNMSDKERKETYKEILSSIGLTLLDENNTPYKTNYYKGVIPTSYIEDKPCIYNGSGIVKNESDRFVIVSNNMVTIKNTDRKVYANVVIQKPENINALSSFYQNIFADLHRCSTTKTQIKWFAFGKLFLNDRDDENIYAQLSVDNLDWFFIKLPKIYSN